jgi:hypothetical protein
MACAGLVAASILLDLVGEYLVQGVSFGSDWFTELVFLAELAAAALIVASRQLRWSALLVGLLSWEWVIATIIWKNAVHAALPEEWPYLVLANIMALAAQVTALVVVLRAGGPTGPASRRRRAIGVVVLGGLAVAIGLAAERLLLLAYDLNTSEGAAVRTIVVLCGAAAVPLVGLIRPTGPALPSLVAGWLLGGLQIAITGTVVLHRNSSGSSASAAAWLWALLVGATIAAAVWQSKLVRRPT